MVIGRMIPNMESGKRLGMTGPHMRAIGSMVKKKEKVLLHNQIMEYIRETFKMTISMEMENSLGMMEGFIRANGQIM